MARGLIIMPVDRSRELLAELLPDVVVSPAYEAGPWRFIIRFGGASDGESNDTSAFVLNRGSVLSAPDLLTKAQQHWQASAVRHVLGGRRVTFYRRYRVHVFDTIPIIMRRAEIGRRRVQSVRPNSTSETRRVAELATRALYVAGLDVGVVDIGLSSKGRLWVINLRVAPYLNRAAAVVYAKHIRDWMQRMENWWLPSLLISQTSDGPRYLLGADPEFTLRDTRSGRMVFASDFFPQQGIVGCDARRVKLGRSGYPLAEVRPRPASCPLELCERIRQALLRAARLAPYRHVQWRAGTLPFRQLPVGGHIHFGMLPTSQLLRALDNYLAVIFLMLENPSAARSRRQRYGWLGDYRLKTHGGFEYRVLPSWLVSPVFTRGALCLAKVIGCSWPSLQHDFFLDPEAQRAFRRADQDYFRAELPQLLADIRRLPSYASYAEEIEAMLAYVEENRLWRTAVDLRRSWGLRSTQRRRS